MAERRRGLGRGIGALIPEEQQENKDRPIDVFFGARVPRAEGVGGGASTQSNEAGASNPMAQNAEETSDAGAARSGSGAATPSASSGAKKASRSKRTTGTEKTKGTNKETSATNTPPDATTYLRDGASLTEGASPTDGASPTEEAALTDEAFLTEDTSPTDHTSATEGTSLTDHGSPTEDGETLVAVPGATFAELPIEQIIPNTRQPRTVFDEDELSELADSIKEVGVLQPIIVRRLIESVENAPQARYELIMGERRWRATELAGLDTVPAIVRDTADEDLLRDALLENLHRVQLNPLEEAAAYQQLLDDFNCTQEELSRRIARSRPQISNTLRLLKLPPLVQRRVAAQVLSAGHARALLGLADPAAMERLAQRIVAEGLSVRQVEEIVALGDEPVATPSRARGRAKRYAPELGELSSRLADRFDTRVKVDMGQRKGTIRIEFASIEDLNRILVVMAPGDDGVMPRDGAVTGEASARVQSEAAGTQPRATGVYATDVQDMRNVDGVARAGFDPAELGGAPGAYTAADSGVELTDPEHYTVD